MIRLTRHGPVVTASQAELDALRDRYDANNYIVLPELIEPELFETLVRRVEKAPFRPRAHQDIALELCMDDQATLMSLYFLASSPAFLRVVEHITGRGPIGEFSGRVYRMTSSDGHYFHWHSDSGNDKLAVMSLNLSREPFCGGALQMKRRGSDEILADVSNTGFGDALIFRLSDTLLHRVQGVEEGVPKTAYAGWFLEGKDRLSAMRQDTKAGDVQLDGGGR